MLRSELLRRVAFFVSFVCLVIFVIQAFLKSEACNNEPRVKMSLKLYNTLTKSKDTFEPITPGKVGLYTCGPTVYNFAHIGNLRTYVFEDILKRVLTVSGYDVHHVMNVTDVGHLVSDADEGEDKMAMGARREGKTVREIADFYWRAFQRDLERLNIVAPDVWCKATDHIAEQIELVEKRAPGSGESEREGKQEWVERNDLPTVAILSTGGTIASRVDYRTGAVTAQFTAEDVLDAMPELRGIANYRARVVYNILSENMRAEYWVELARVIAEEIENGAHAVIVTDAIDPMG